MEMMGRRYVIDCCISAFRAKQEDLIYRVYVTDLLRALTRADCARYYDLIKPTKDDGQTVVETVNDIKDRLRGLNDEQRNELGSEPDA